MSRYQRLSEGVSVYTTQLLAIIWAMQWVEEVRPGPVVICSDSASVLMTLKEGGLGARSDLMVELLTLMHRIEQAGELVGFLWVPAHVGIEGNELADGAAKRALRREKVDVKVRLGLTECRSIIKRNIMAVWQEEWDREKKGRHYYSLQKSVTRSQCFLGKERRHTGMMTRLRLGHCGLAWDLHKIGKHEDGLCGECGKNQTVEHVLMECAGLALERERLNAAVGATPVTLRSLLGPIEDQRGIVKAVLEFMAATRQIKRD